MREIKFRGQRIDNNEWVYDYFVKAPNGECRIYWQPFKDATSNTYHLVESESISQFTGLKDKNGKEMYEGDIVNNSGKPFGMLKTDQNNYLIKWREGKYGDTSNKTWLKEKPGFVFDKIGAGMSYIFTQSQIEVIGNIRENKDLLS